MKYNKINNLFGWITGAIAYLVYLKTMEPTVSFWDCGEFLSCAAKLEVGHSPGAPLFMMMQRLFAIFAPSAATQALFINSFSALVSALTILFLFWTITHYAKKLLVPKGEEVTGEKMALIMGAGLVGGLAYTFSDTFWFSAVEAEVYATSSFFTAITFWAMLKWENVADEKYADRWLVLIAYLIGLSVGVHLLNLLCIPPVVMIWYFRRYAPTVKGGIIAFLVSCVLLGFVQIGIIQYIPKIAANFDIMFTNSFGLPFDIGSITFVLLLCGGLVWLLTWAKKKQHVMLHTGILSVIFIIIGYSSYIVPVIRSRAEVPVDMTNPDNAFSLNSYVSREQFGSQPLLTGPDFTSPMTSVKETGKIYTQVQKNGKDLYEETGVKREGVYDPATTRFFPRVWDGSEGHASFYRSYLGLAEGQAPTGADNLSFFFGYQMNWMWWRYFMWNYAGRQNDFEGQGDAKNGNWISGIKMLDKGRVGDLDKMSDGFKNNGARNQLYFLPLILGIMGVVYQFNRKKKDGLIVALLFFFTGAAIGIFLNMTPGQPRERDYAFAGATYAFAVWIGLGVIMVYDLIARAVKGYPAAIGATVLCLVAVPTLMAKEEWDDHDRSQKRLAWSTAYNDLMSCEPNAILVTFGDNDTYPLWYLQEVEGVRKDVRIMINTLIGTEWFIDQLQRKINDADAVPMVWKRDDYMGSRHEHIRYMDSHKVPQDKYYDLYDIVKFMCTKDGDGGQDGEGYIPALNVFVKGLSKEELIKKGMLDAADTGAIINEMKFSLPREGMYKNDVTLVNMIAENAKNGWARPIYLSGGFPGNDTYLGLHDYLRQEGMVYRLVPYKKVPTAESKQVGMNINLNKSYDLFMNKFKWGGGETNTVYFDEKNRVMMMAYRIYASQIADDLSAHGRNAEAVQLLDKVKAGITSHAYYYELTTFYMAMSYYKAGAKEKGRDLSLALTKNCEDDVEYMLTLDDNQREYLSRDIRNDASMVNTLASTAQTAGDAEGAKVLNDKFQAIYNKVKGSIRQ
ncbi:DUF2723 domain-containing protein [Flavipsychrobacter stenotrophus]|uniref:DUF2723 domain-containing protein n=1 Tax=Flavipsychrobacter stenotrophus TaxID=2077091 RepID=A0A2S7SVG7_9BACT|nr:DUF2723 domain-containing protein [Flavipsychrobacter stenotrophus]PQJ10617.1 DUF2723 domain-containing protein [Flavipsychrobacter stenotrophus]